MSRWVETLNSWCKLGNESSGLLYGDCKLHLFTNDVQLTPGMVLGDFIEPVFPGYAAQDLEWGECVAAPGSAFAVMPAAAVRFMQTGAHDPTTVKGAFIKSTANGLIAAVTFDEPIFFNAMYAQHQIIVQKTFGPQA